MHFFDRMGLSPKQREFLEVATGRDQHDPITLFGGAGGGGKSYGLRALCVYGLLLLEAYGFPNQRAVLACSTYPLLRDRHIGKFLREYAWLGAEVGTSMEHGLHVRFKKRPNMGVVCLRNLEDPNNYRGTEAPIIAVDEATELPEHIEAEPILGTLLYPLRTEKEFPFSSLSFGSNPDGVGHIWVKNAFITCSEQRGLRPERFGYIEAKSTDNPHINESWYENLNALSADTRNARLNADWTMPKGARFPMLRKDTHIFRFKDRFPRGIPGHYTKIMGVDYGLQAPYAATWHAIDEQGDIWTYREDYRSGLHDEAQAKRILEMTKENEIIEVMRCDPAMWSKKPAHNGPVEPAYIEAYERILGADKFNRFKSIEKGYNQSRGHSFGSLHKLLERGNQSPDWYIEESCEHLWRELTALVWDTRGIYGGVKEDVDPRLPDHAVDSCRMALHSYLEPSKEQNGRIVLTGNYDQDRMAYIVEKENEYFEQYISQSS
jgi:phage terminase large subunit